MGTEMTAFIEYDLTPDEWPWRGPHAPTEMPPPFSVASGTPYSVSERGSLYTGSKDYLFFAAIAGVRNERDVLPLFPPRGLPPNLSPEAEKERGADGSLAGFADSWLRLSEIEAALDHHQVRRELLSFETHTLLDIMRSLVRRLGDDHVRLVFGFD